MIFLYLMARRLRRTMHLSWQTTAAHGLHILIEAFTH